MFEKHNMGKMEIS